MFFVVVNCMTCCSRHEDSHAADKKTTDKYILYLPGVNIRIIDPFTIKPLDASTIVASARATGGRVITVEDHYKEGELLILN